MCSELITWCGITYHMACPWKKLIYSLCKSLLACSFSSSYGPCKISPIHVTISICVVIMKDMFRQQYCWGFMSSFSVLYKRHYPAVKKCGFLALIVFLASPPEHSLSLKYRGCVADVPAEVRQPTVTSLLYFYHSLFLWWYLSATRRNFFDEWWKLYLPLGIWISFRMKLGSVLLRIVAVVGRVSARIHGLTSHG